MTDTVKELQNWLTVQSISCFFFNNQWLLRDPFTLLLTCLFSLDAIINENYKYLKGFLEDLAPPERSALIQDWEMAGLVYLDYIRVIEMLDRIQQVTD